MIALQHKRVLGIRFAAIVETLVFLTLAVIASYWIDDGQRFVGYTFHPFFILILLVTVQYGTLEGIIATLITTLFLYAGNIPEQKLTESLFEYQFRLAILPLIWFCTAFVIGELRMRWEFDRQQMERELFKQKEQNKVVADEYENLKQAKENLEARLVSQEQSVAILYRTMQSLGTLKPAQVILHLNDVVKAAFNPKKFSFYVQGEGGLEVAANEGWETGDNYPLRILPSDPLYVEIVGRERVVSVVNRHDEEVLRGHGMLAGPLINPQSGEIFGMLKVEEMGYLQLNISTLQIFQSISELIGVAYANAESHQEMLKNAIFGPNRRFYSRSYAELQKPYLKEILACMQGSLFQVFIKVRGWSSLDFTLREKMEKALRHKFEKIYSTKSQLFRDQEGQYLALVPLLEGAEVERRSLCLLEELIKEGVLEEGTLQIEIEDLIREQKKTQSIR